MCNPCRTWAPDLQASLVYTAYLYWRGLPVESPRGGGRRSLCILWSLCSHTSALTQRITLSSRQPSVNGDWLSQWEMAIFGPLQNRHPLTNRQKICHRWLRRRPLHLCQIWCTSALGGRLGEWVNYNLNFYYLFRGLRRITYRSSKSVHRCDLCAWRSD